MAMRMAIFLPPPTLIYVKLEEVWDFWKSEGTFDLKSEKKYLVLGSEKNDFLLLGEAYLSFSRRLVKHKQYFKKDMHIRSEERLKVEELVNFILFEILWICLKEWNAKSTKSIFRNSIDKQVDFI